MKQTSNSQEHGNVVVVVLVALVVLAVGGMAYFSGHLTKDNKMQDTSNPAAVETASGDQANAGEAVTAPAPAPQQEIKPGNPVVAKIGDRDVTRIDVFNFMQTLPADTRQLPMDQLFPLVQNQLINMALVKEKSAGANLDEDPLVKQQLEAAKQNIIPVVFMQREVEKALNDERLKAAYDQYVANFPEIQEAKARHILVEDEAKAKDLISQLNGGASFEELAKEHSTDSTAEKGGELGYFAKTDVVPEFGEAAFAQEINAVSATPIKSQFGYHIIKVEERRQRPPAEFEQAKPFLAGQLRNAVTNEIVEKWRSEAGVELFDINGDAIEPSAGDE